MSARVTYYSGMFFFMVAGVLGAANFTNPWIATLPFLVGIVCTVLLLVRSHPVFIELSDQARNFLGWAALSLLVASQILVAFYPPWRPVANVFLALSMILYLFKSASQEKVSHIRHKA